MNAQVDHHVKMFRIIRQLEKHVKAGNAERIYAGNFEKDISTLIQKDMLTRFQLFSGATNPNEVNVVYVILTPDPDHIWEKQDVKEIALEYLDALLLQHQPFLVYSVQNEIHILTPGIGLGVGHYTDKHLLRQIERSYVLRTAGQHPPLIEWLFDDSDEPTAFGITFHHTWFNIMLPYYTCHFTYNSLEALNFVLSTSYTKKLATIQPKTTPFATRGELVYFLLDNDGNKIMPGIRACELLENLGLDYIKRRCKFVSSNLGSEFRSIILMLDKLFDAPLTATELQDRLKARGITCHFIYNEEGNIENIWLLSYNARYIIDCKSLGNYNFQSIMLNQQS